MASGLVLTRRAFQCVDITVPASSEPTRIAVQFLPTNNRLRAKVRFEAPKQVLIGRREKGEWIPKTKEIVNGHD